MLFFFFSGGTVLSIKVIMILIPTSLSPHHSINKADPLSPQKSSEKGWKPCFASYFRCSQTEKKEVQLRAPTGAPASMPRFQPQITMLSAGYPTLFPPWHLDRTGLYFIPGTCPQDAIWATFGSKHDSCLHLQHQVNARPGSLLRNTLCTAGKQWVLLGSGWSKFIPAALLIFYICQE